MIPFCGPWAFYCPGGPLLLSRMTTDIPQSMDTSLSSCLHFLSDSFCSLNGTEKSRKSPRRVKCNGSLASITGRPALCSNAWKNTEDAQDNWEALTVVLAHGHIRVYNLHISPSGYSSSFWLYRSLHSQQGIVGNTCNIH